MRPRSRVAVLDSARNQFLQAPDLETEILADTADVSHLLLDGHDDLPGRLAGFDGLILWRSVPLTAGTIARLPGVHAIVRAAVGFDNIDVAAAARQGIPVSHIPEYGTEEVADHTLALILGALRNVQGLAEATRAGSWDWRDSGPVRRIRGRRLGVVGLGRIGTAVALRALAFGLRVGFHDPYLPPGREKSLGLDRFETLDELAAGSEIITVHTPLTAGTRHLISADVLRAMPTGAVLVNTARGEVVDTEALLAQLRAGRLGHVALDVVEGEPAIPAELRSLPQVTLTPHTAFYSQESLVELRTRSAQSARRLLRGLPEPRVVNAVQPRDGGGREDRT